MLAVEATVVEVVALAAGRVWSEQLVAPMVMVAAREAFEALAAEGKAVGTQAGVDIAAVVEPVEGKVAQHHSAAESMGSLVAVD